MNVYRVGELWRRMYELGNQVGESWRLAYELEKQAGKSDAPECAHKATGEPCSYPACGRPAEYCETQPVSTGSYELRLYWLCRQHAELRDAEEEWGDHIAVYSNGSGFWTKRVKPGRKRRSSPCSRKSAANGGGCATSLRLTLTA